MHISKGKTYERQGKASTGLIFILLPLLTCKPINWQCFDVDYRNTKGESRSLRPRFQRAFPRDCGGQWCHYLLLGKLFRRREGNSGAGVTLESGLPQQSHIC